MEDSQNADNRLNSLFNKAADEEPVISINEITKIVSSHQGVASSGSGIAKSIINYKLWLGCAALIISGIAAYIYFNDSGNIVNTDHVPESVIQPTPQSSIITSGNSSNENNNNANTNEAISLKHNEQVTNGINSSDKSYSFGGAVEVSFEYENKDIYMLIDKEVEQLTIDGATISKSDYQNYADIINKGLDMKVEADKNNNIKPANETPDELANKKIMKTLVEQMDQDGIIEAGSSFDITLTSEKLKVNDVQLPDSTFKKYKVLFESISGSHLTRNSKISIKH